MNATLTMRTAAVSETGRREGNEDAVYASTRLAVVADGVGGAAAGEVASRLVVAKLMGLDKSRLWRTLEDELSTRIQDANAVVGFVVSCRPECTGMGSTITAVALANDGRYLIANVGDSRTYLLRDGELRQLTRDQSLVQELVDRGIVTASQARRHPQRSIVLQVLDGGAQPLPPVVTADARLGDRLLLCSDGVSDYVEDTEIACALGVANREAAAAGLVGLALDNGGRDNVSVVIADVVAGGEPSAGWLEALPLREVA